MIELPKVIEKGSQYPFRLTQVKRDGSIALYEREELYSPQSKPSYEVIRVIPKPDGVKFPNGVFKSPHEAYPPASQWGNYGWSFQKIENAEDKYNELLNSKG